MKRYKVQHEKYSLSFRRLLRDTCVCFIEKKKHQIDAKIKIQNFPVLSFFIHICICSISEDFHGLEGSKLSKTKELATQYILTNRMLVFDSITFQNDFK